MIAAQARCDALGNLCRGFPPESCLAFDAVPSLTDVRMCTPCEDMPFGLLVFLVTSLVLGLVSLLAIYITLMLRHPQALKRWGSSVEIILSHTRTMVILSELQVEWPRSVQAILAGPDLTLLPDLLDLPSAACFVNVGGSPFWQFANSVLWSVVLAFGALLLVQQVARSRDPNFADRLEYVLALAFGMQLPRMLSLSFSVIFEVGSALGRRATYVAAVFALIATIFIFSLDVFLLMRFYGNILAYQRGRAHDDYRPWRWLPEFRTRLGIRRHPSPGSTGGGGGSSGGSSGGSARAPRSRGSSRTERATVSIEEAWSDNVVIKEPVGITIDCKLEGAVVTRVTKRNSQLVVGDTIVNLNEMSITDFFEPNAAMCVIENAAARGTRVKMEVTPQSAQHWGSFMRATRASTAAANHQPPSGDQPHDVLRAKERYDVQRLGELEVWYFSTQRMFIIDADWLRHWQQWCLDQTRDDRPGRIPMFKLQDARGKPPPEKTFLRHYNIVSESVWKVLERSHGCEGKPMPRKVGGPQALYSEEATEDGQQSSTSESLEAILAIGPPRSFMHGCQMALDNFLMGVCAPWLVMLLPYDMGRAYGVAGVALGMAIVACAFLAPALATVVALVQVWRGMHATLLYHTRFRTLVGWCFGLSCLLSCVLVGIPGVLATYDWVRSGFLRKGSSSTGAPSTIGPERIDQLCPRARANAAFMWLLVASHFFLAFVTPWLLLPILVLAPTALCFTAYAHRLSGARSFGPTADVLLAEKAGDFLHREIKRKNAGREIVDVTSTHPIASIFEVDDGDEDEAGGLAEELQSELFELPGGGSASFDLAADDGAGLGFDQVQPPTGTFEEPAVTNPFLLDGNPPSIVAQTPAFLDVNSASVVVPNPFLDDLPPSAPASPPQEEALEIQVDSEPSASGRVPSPGRAATRSARFASTRSAVARFAAARSAPTPSDDRVADAAGTQAPGAEHGWIAAYLARVRRRIKSARMRASIVATSTGSYYHIEPYQLEKRVLYLTLRFNSESSRWQMVVWSRQIILVFVSFIADNVIRSLQRALANEDESQKKARERIQAARYVLQVTTILITLIFWYAHAQKQPYPLPAQNSLESCLFFVTTLVLLFGLIYSALLRSLIDVDEIKASLPGKVDVSLEPTSGVVVEEVAVQPLHERIKELCDSSTAGEIVSTLLLGCANTSTLSSFLPPPRLQFTSHVPCSHVCLPLSYAWSRV